MAASEGRPALPPGKHTGMVCGESSTLRKAEYLQRVQGCQADRGVAAMRSDRIKPNPETGAGEAILAASRQPTSDRPARGTIQIICRSCPWAVEKGALCDVTSAFRDHRAMEARLAEGLRDSAMEKTTGKLYSLSAKTDLQRRARHVT